MNREFSKFLSFEKLNLTDAHFLNFLISLKVYIVISIYTNFCIYTKLPVMCTKIQNKIQNKKE